MVKIARSSVVRRYEVNRIKKTKTYHSIISLYLKQNEGTTKQKQILLLWQMHWLRANRNIYICIIFTNWHIDFVFCIRVSHLIEYDAYINI